MYCTGVCYCVKFLNLYVCIVVEPPATARSISADSLVSIGSEVVDLDRNSSTIRAELMRPLSMIGMPGSLEGEQPVTPNAVTPVDERKLLQSSSRELLRTINEDISKIRERKAMLSNSSSERSLDRCLAESTPDRHASPPAVRVADHSAADVGAADLPSHSICVDSGLVMDEGEFCEPAMQPLDRTEHMVIIEHSPDPSLIDEPTTMFQAAIPRIHNQSHNISSPKIDVSVDRNQSNEVSRKFSKEEMRQKFSRSRTENISGTVEDDEHDNDPLLAAIQAQQQMEVEAALQANSRSNSTAQLPTGAEQNILITSTPKADQPVINVNVSNSNSNTNISVSSSGSETTPVKKRSKKPPKALPVKEEKIVSKKKQSMAQSAESGSDTQGALEPLLSSQNVPLKTKLQHLSTLYDCEDDVNIKIKKVEPSGPYDIFKAPTKLGHQRSK